jgi:hypothetical protein
LDEGQRLQCFFSRAAIDELVESTGMKPSQIVACTAELGGRIAKLRNVCFDAKEAIFIDEGVSRGSLMTSTMLVMVYLQMTLPGRRFQSSEH